MTDSVQQFYDDLAEDYHLIFADWMKSVRWQSEMLDTVIREFSLQTPPASLLDCSCGIGTQAFGLAERGYHVLGTDLSPMAIARARELEQHFDVDIQWDVADFRHLEDKIEDTFDIIISCDNALPHLTEDEDLALATRSMVNRLKPGGLILISIRDYDQILTEKPKSTPVVTHDSAEGRRIVFQVWDWHEDQPVYTINHFILKDTKHGWQTGHRTTVYRALQRNELTTFLIEAGFIDVQWLLPEGGKYFAPLVIGRKGAISNVRILLVQLADIGDLIVTTPAMAALREALPDAAIDLLTSAHAAPIVENTGLVNNIITIDRKALNQSKAFFSPTNLRGIYALRHNHYDTIIFFHHFTLKLGTIKFALIAAFTGAKRRLGLQNGNGWFLTENIPDDGFGAKHQAQYWLDLVGLLGADTAYRPAIINIQANFTLPDDVDSSKKTVVIHPGSGGYSLARRWDAANFAAVADNLQSSHNAQVILVGTANDDTQAVIEAMQTEPIDLTGKTTSLAELAAVIQQADLFIGADSGVMHVASATGTPVVSIFGPSNHQAWHPWTQDNHAVIRSAPECSPCSYVEHGIGLRDGCPARTCMRMVTPDQVLNMAGRFLSGESLRDDTTRNPPSQRKLRMEILGLPVDAITFDGWLDRIDEWVSKGERCHHVCTTNPEFSIIAQSDPNFRNILKRADLCVPDGVGLLWAARRLGTPLPERVTGSDGVPLIAERAAQKGWKLFFLGAAPGIADQAADILIAKHPTLQIVGTYSGSPAPEEEDQLVGMVNASGADILFVAYGAPEQDKWIARNTPRLQVKMAMGVGGAFDFIAGIIPRAPVRMQQAGLEWLYRLYLQPSRIGRMMRLPRFVLQVLFCSK